MGPAAVFIGHSSPFLEYETTFGLLARGSNDFLQVFVKGRRAAAATGGTVEFPRKSTWQCAAESDVSRVTGATGPGGRRASPPRRVGNKGKSNAVTGVGP